VTSLTGHSSDTASCILSPHASAGGCHHWAAGACGSARPISTFLLPLEPVRHTPRDAQQLAPHAVRIHIWSCLHTACFTAIDSISRHCACRKHPRIGTRLANAQAVWRIHHMHLGMCQLHPAGWHCASWKCHSHGSSALCRWRIHHGQRWCWRLSAARCSSPGALMAAPSCM
jgi:hypothetical protein